MMRRILESRRLPVLAAMLAVVACRGERAQRVVPTDSVRAAATMPSAPLMTREARALALADSLYLAGDVDGARGIWTPLLADAERRGDSLTVARHLTALGLAARKANDFPLARRLLERSVAIKEQLQLREEMFRSVNALGLVAWQEGRLSEASALFERAARAAVASGSVLDEAKAAGNLGLVRKDLGDHDGARAGMSRQLVVAREAGDSLSAARALNNLGMLDAELGDPLAAIAALEEARGLYRSLGDAEGEENALGQLAVAHDALGEPQRAIAFLDSAIALARRQGLRLQEGEDLALLGHLYHDAGQHRAALEQHGQAQAIFGALGLPKQLGDGLRAEARTRAALGQHALARAKAEEALRIHRDGGFHLSSVDDLLLLTELAREARRDAEAQAHLRVAMRLADSLGIDVVREKVRLADARTAEAAGDATRALRILDAGGARTPGAGSSATWEADAIRLRAYARLGQSGAAAAAGRRALAALERIRVNYAPGALRTSFTADKSRLYADLLVVLLQLGRVDEAFEVADAARGRALLEHLALVRREVQHDLGRDTTGGDRGGGSPLGSILETQRLLGRIDALTRELRRLEERDPRERGGGDVAMSRAIADRLAEARSAYEAFLLRRGAGDATGAALLGARRVRLGTVRAFLAADESLVEYFVAPDRLVAFVVTRDGVRTVETPVPASELAGQVRLARELLGRRGGAREAARDVLVALHHVLFRPLISAGALDSARRLIVVPHASLAYLPFSALIDARTGQALAERFALLHLPSAAALPAVRGEHDGTPLERARVVALAPFPSLLPATLPEAHGVHRALGAGADPVVGSAATEGALRRALRGDAIVHLATHGVMNARNPMFSRVDLVASPARPSDDDGRLEVHEVLSMAIRSPLVFLSGCETGVGAAWSTHFDQGEDHATLAQSFLYAGARNVVATLWRIEDDGAAAFAQHFYRELRRHSPPEALAAAQRAMARDARYGAPYYWAGYQLAGAGGDARGGSGASATSSANPASASVYQW